MVSKSYCSTDSGLLVAATACLLTGSIPVCAQISVTLQPSISPPAAVGTLVNWKAEVVDDAEGPHWYRFATQGFGEPRKIVKDFGPDSMFDWVPNEREGLYAIEVTVRNIRTGQQYAAVATYEVRPNVTAGQPSVSETPHPLVMLYSAPVCSPGAIMNVYFLGPDGPLQNAPPKRCDGLFSMNFYIAGLRPQTSYYIKHIVEDGGAFIEGPVMEFVSGEAPQGLPEHWVALGTPRSQSQPVMLAGSLFTNFVATDLEGRLIWYYPEVMTFLTHPERGGYFWAINEDHSGDESRQIVRLFDVVGITVLETNAARVNEQLEALGKRRINAFHHEARFLSNGNIVVLAGVEQIMNGVQGSGPVNILGDMIIVLNRDLEVVWTWDAFDHLDVRRMATQLEVCNPDACPPLFLHPEANDWLHGNAVTETPEGDLLLSLRHQDWIIKIAYRHGTGSGDVLWRLGKDGDFTIQSEDLNPWFSHQHDAEIEPDATMSLFDNSNLRRAEDPNAHSRGQVFRLDEANRVAELVLNADLGVYAFALGSAQKLDDGNYFFDAGFRDDGTGISVEVDPEGHPTYGIEGTAPEYRTFRIKNMYNF